MSYFQLIIACFLFSLAACEGSKTNVNAKDRIDSADTLSSFPTQSVQYKRGDLVPTEQVCMVNDAFMGKKQLLVIHEGKEYYGCCEMCKERIPKEASVRIAIDPFSKKEVDKAEATIAITGNQGEVSYFESETNYRSFFNNLN